MMRYPLAQARFIADALISLLRPSCERVEVAGSVRRGRPDVGDIELVCIPRVERVAVALFGTAHHSTDHLDRRLQELIAQHVLDYRLNSRGSRTYGPLNNKMLRHVASGIPLDIFSTSGDAWGLTLFIRTGPKELNIKAMQRFHQLGLRGHLHTVTDRQGQIFHCPTEAAVFRLLQWPYLPPQSRS